jgi:hypothetical protein
VRSSPAPSPWEVWRGPRSRFVRGWGGVGWDIETCNVTSPYWYAVLTRLTLSNAVMLMANQGGTERRLMKPGTSTSSPGRLGKPAETATWAQEGQGCKSGEC